ncbi:uncharacterized protein SPPG_05152 [Spizellomyces punctatus DAOM BR117]|uniref:UBC core domain-containing protein n=1 Tax=Spizellomyces punctatus (strain DAOM BR117) TaxID=645134 RepID=A0A0L0HE90_SPIPD|nr:uncharacterized protein SPPG_05152 [Spizellomyces punctatus DAOM BR117]KNC99775.1 hypothetical protein SPPG_05152 [Spizellomyces punctatus DAOM BR117]|eukprot:XP_016607815.1 hypothetical protein SPPG_05152 [Spizellomyces punctatus DAOM BR117]
MKIRTDKSEKFLEREKLKRKRETTQFRESYELYTLQKDTGTGYGGQCYTRGGRNLTAKISKEREHMDELASACVTALKNFLPNSNRQPEPYMFDYLPDPDLRKVLTESCFLPWILEYLQNDSLMDIANRSSLYFNIISLLDLLSTHEYLIPILIQRFPEPQISDYHELCENRRKKMKTTDMNVKPQQHSVPQPTAVKELDYTVPLLDALKTLVQQTNVFSQSMMVTLSDNIGVQEGEENGGALNADQEEMMKVVTLATDINDLWKKINDRISSFRLLHKGANEKFDDPSKLDRPSKSEVKMKDETPKKPKTYVELMKLRLLQYAEIWSDRNPAPKTIDGTQILKSNRTIYIAKEMATLSTSLPCSDSSAVFVRIDNDNMNIIKCVITGPTETPYSYGCFEFNITFPNMYPDVPPQVTLLTTGNGSVRFNPNLYQCGKVCLSLLGTWNGSASERWQTGKNQSTLLQVVTSIQSMILIDTPYYNEPSHGTPQKTRLQNIQYNRVIRRNCVKEAMIGILRKPPVGFEDVIRDHFYLKETEIMKQVKEWAAEDDRWDGTHYIDAMGATHQSFRSYGMMSGAVSGILGRIAPSNSGSWEKLIASLEAVYPVSPSRYVEEQIREK